MSPTKNRVVNYRSIPDLDEVLLHPGGLDLLLQEPGLVHDQHTVRLAELLDEPTARVAAHPVDIPAGPLSNRCIPSGASARQDAEPLSPGGTSTGPSSSSAAIGLTLLEG